MYNASVFCQIERWRNFPPQNKTPLLYSLFIICFPAVRLQCYYYIIYSASLFAASTSADGISHHKIRPHYHVLYVYYIIYFLAIRSHCCCFVVVVVFVVKSTLLHCLLSNWALLEFPTITYIASLFAVKLSGRDQRSWGSTCDIPSRLVRGAVHGLET